MTIAERKGNAMSIRTKGVFGALCAGLLVGATSVATPASATVPNTMVNSQSNFNILEVPPPGSTGRLYVGGPLFQTVLAPGTTLQTSTTSWINPADNTIVIPKIPTVTGTVTAKDIDPRGSVFAVTTDSTYRTFKGNGLPSTPMGKFGPVPPVSYTHLTLPTKRIV